MLAVIPLVSLTDNRWPARHIYLASGALSALCCFRMALCDSHHRAAGGDCLGQQRQANISAAELSAMGPNPTTAMSRKAVATSSVKASCTMGRLSARRWAAIPGRSLRRFPAWHDSQMTEFLDLPLERQTIEGFEPQAREKLDAGFERLMGITERADFFGFQTLHRGGVRHAPMRGYRSFPQCSSNASARMLRAELPVQRNRTL
jgi:hypothetical protein